MSGILYGVGLGPGDPELMTLKAARYIHDADVIVYFTKGGKRGHAYAIAASHIRETQEDMPLIYPVTNEIPVNDPVYEKKIHDFYEASAAQISEHLRAGKKVAVLCVGDPFFYGSFMHLYRRLNAHFTCHVAAGITAMSGSWTAAHTPITWGDDVLTVIPGTLPTAELTERLRTTDAAVIMKLGSNFPRVREAIVAAGILERAIYVEYGTMQAEKILPLVQKMDTPAPYFSLILIPGNGRKL